MSAEVVVAIVGGVAVLGYMAFIVPRLCLALVAIKAKLDGEDGEG